MFVWDDYAKQEESSQMEKEKSLYWYKLSNTLLKSTIKENPLQQETGELA